MTTEQKLGPVDRNPRLSATKLTILLLILAAVPSFATVGMFYMMPGTKEGQLPVRFAIYGMPDKDFFDKPAVDRKLVTKPSIVLKNLSNQPWININIEINKRFEIRDTQKVIQPGEIIKFNLEKFYEKRSGIAYPPELLPVNHVRIFAKVGETSRESWSKEIGWDDLGKEIENLPSEKEK